MIRNCSFAPNQLSTNWLWIYEADLIAANGNERFYKILFSPKKWEVEKITKTKQNFTTEIIKIIMLISVCKQQVSSVTHNNILFTLKFTIRHFFDSILYNQTIYNTWL